jgi:hypothetical protein
MIELMDILTALGIGCLSILIPLYIVKIYLESSHILEDMITNGIINVINEAQTNEILQKNIYTLGALVGNGIASGSGMKNTVKGGKMNLNNLIAEIAGNWIQNTMLNPSPSPSQPSPLPSPQQRDKFFNT